MTHDKPQQLSYLRQNKGESLLKVTEHLPRNSRSSGFLLFLFLSEGRQGLGHAATAASTEAESRRLEAGEAFADFRSA